MKRLRFVWMGLGLATFLILTITLAARIGAAQSGSTEEQFIREVVGNQLISIRPLSPAESAPRPERVLVAGEAIETSSPEPRPTRLLVPPEPTANGSTIERLATDPSLAPQVSDATSNRPTRER